MSVFKVALNNSEQGLMDLNPATATAGFLGNQMQPSIQRTIFVAGPGRTYRMLADGVQFTDCNYWKRFAYPQVPLSQAFITVVTDDGSIYSDTEEDSTYALIFGGSSTYSVLTTDTFATNYIDILGTYGSYATFVQIENLGTVADQNIKVQFNGSTTATMSLKFGVTQIFNAGDLLISKLAFQGGVADSSVQVVLSVKSVCNS